MYVPEEASFVYTSNNIKAAGDDDTNYNLWFYIPNEEYSELTMICDEASDCEFSRQTTIRCTDTGQQSQLGYHSLDGRWYCLDPESGCCPEAFVKNDSVLYCEEDACVIDCSQLNANTSCEWTTIDASTSTSLALICSDDYPCSRSTVYCGNASCDIICGHPGDSSDSGTGTCEDLTVIGTTASLLAVDCATSYSCTSSTITCPHDAECLIHCGGEKACYYATLNGTGSSIFHLVCDDSDGAYSCHQPNVYGGLVTDIYCAGQYPCYYSYFYLYDTANVSVTCESTKEWYEPCYGAKFYLDETANADFSFVAHETDDDYESDQYVVHVTCKLNKFHDFSVKNTQLTKANLLTLGTFTFTLKMSRSLCR